MGEKPKMRYFIVHGAKTHWNDSEAIESHRPWLEAVLEFDHMPLRDELRRTLAEQYQLDPGTIRVTGFTEVNAEDAASYRSRSDCAGAPPVNPPRYPGDCILL